MSEVEPVPTDVPVSMPDGPDVAGLGPGPVPGETEALPPAHLGSRLGSLLQTKLHELLLQAPGQLGTVYRAMAGHPAAGPTELLPYTECANAGVVGNRRVIVFAIMEEVRPTASSVARQAARTVRKLLKASTDADVQAHLTKVLATLEDVAGDEQAVEAENKQLSEDSAVLAEALKQASGVYVYTYPHYWRHPHVPDTERRLLKIGRTTSTAWGRVLGQARQTGMPEDPLLLRVYKTDDPTSAEKKFHMLLDAAEHDRSAGAAVGKEWFSTTIDFCDVVAQVMGLEVLRGADDVGS